MNAELGPAAVDLTVSIANRNGKDFLHNCLASIFSGTRGISYEIIVVDNDSTDGSVEMLRNAFPSVRILENDIPRGYGASHNQAFQFCRGRFFLVLNNDMIVRDGALNAMCARIASDESIGLLGCRLFNPDGSTQVSCGRESSVFRIFADDLVPTSVPVERLGLREWMREWNHESEREVDVVQGSCMLLRREVLDRAGRFDEDFEFYREEFDLCRRVKQLGLRVMFFPGAEIVHFGGQTFKTIPLPAYQIFFESRYKYFMKNWGRASAAVVTCSAFAGVLARLAAWSALRTLRLREASVARERVTLYTKMLLWFFSAGRPWTAR